MRVSPIADSFTYAVSDGAAASTPQTASLEFIDPPRAFADSYDGGQDQELAVSAPGVLANDTVEPGADFGVVFEGRCNQFGIFSQPTLSYAR